SQAFGLDQGPSTSRTPVLARPPHWSGARNSTIPPNALAISGHGGHIARRNWIIFMADVANRYPENVPGKYYVDNQCIDCDLCRETAPNNFTRNDDGGYSYVYK